jgi:hypothetical protein
VGHQKVYPLPPVQHLGHWSILRDQATLGERWWCTIAAHFTPTLPPSSQVLLPSLIHSPSPPPNPIPPPVPMMLEFLQR